MNISLLKSILFVSHLSSKSPLSDTCIFPLEHIWLSSSHTHSNLAKYRNSLSYENHRSFDDGQVHTKGEHELHFYNWASSTEITDKSEPMCQDMLAIC